jgi:5-formyltetrahydrofolate cyclo-ligase
LLGLLEADFADVNGGNDGYVAIYRSVASEVSTVLLEQELELRNVKVATPLVLGDGIMDFVDSTTNQKIEPDQIATMIVPLVAFNSACRRLGMGGGFYDRYVPKINKKIPIYGIAYDQQFVKDLPCELHDIALTAIITQSRIWR